MNLCLGPMLTLKKEWPSILKSNPCYNTIPQHAHTRNTLATTLQLYCDWCHTKISVQPKLRFFKKIVATEPIKRGSRISTLGPPLRHLPWFLKPPAYTLKFWALCTWCLESLCKIQEDSTVKLAASKTQNQKGGQVDVDCIIGSLIIN